MGVVSEGNLVNSLGQRMIRLEPGEFLMGSADQDAKWDEQPVHRVIISRALYVSERVVSVEEYREFRPDFEENPEYTPAACGMSWYDASAFCRWLGEREGKPYRLPTEAEWEYICRSVEDPSAAAPVLNLLTGVMEWCLDWYGDYPEGDQEDPVGPEGGSAKIVRGGCLDAPTQWHTEEDLRRLYSRPSNRAAIAPAFGFFPGCVNKTGRHRIGFRVVQAPEPPSRPLPYSPPYIQHGVRKTAGYISRGPDPKKSYLRKRYLLPTPPENLTREAIDAAGFPPSFRFHNHSPALEVCPNGDLLMIIFSSYYEHEPETSLIGSRLRFGEEEWDFPSPFLQFPGANDTAPLLWNDGGVLHLFWGNRQAFGKFPFQWISSGDSGETWSEVKFPRFPEGLGRYCGQPISSAFRGADGGMYVSGDGSGATSVLWTSPDDGSTWYDTGGRTPGRHTAYVPLKDGSILGMGGKSSDIDGFMPKAVSRDGGRTWKVSRADFCCLGSNQRPSIIRLESGRLFFAGDFQAMKRGFQPKGIDLRGSYVALSEDEGGSWHVKKLAGTQPHENPQFAASMRGDTLGYSVARQGPNGLIHLISTMNRPCLHFELNEAWILEDSKTAAVSGDDVLMASASRSISGEKDFRETYPDGGVKAEWWAGIGDDGRYLLHGDETWYYENGGKKRQACYEMGRKTGEEFFWSSSGGLLWHWTHNAEDLSIWTQYWPDGGKKAESFWRSFHCEGPATHWDTKGNVVSRITDPLSMQTHGNLKVPKVTERGSD